MLLALPFQFDEVLLQIRTEITSEDVKRGEGLREELLTRSKMHMKKLVDEGRIEFFEFFEERMKTVWQHFKKEPSQPKVTLLLAQGCPHLPFVKVLPGKGAGTMALLTISAPCQTVASWSFTWLAMHLQKAVTKLGFQEPIHLPQIHAAWLRASKEDSAVKEFPIERSSLMPGTKLERPFQIFVRQQAHEIFVAVQDFHYFRSEYNKAAFLAEIKSETLLAAEGNSEFTYFILSEHIAKTLAEGMQGIESLGISTPACFLVSLGFRKNLREGDGNSPDSTLQDAWYLPLLRELSTLEEFEPEPEWIMTKLNVWLGYRQIMEGIKHLAQRRLIRLVENAEKPLQTMELIVGDATLSQMSPTQYQHLMISEAEKSISETTQTRREINAVTFFIPEKIIPTITEKILAFARSVRKRSERLTFANQVYQLNFQLFPFTRIPDFEPPGKTSPLQPAHDTSAEWSNTVVRELVALPEFSADPLWIAEQLLFPISEKQAQQSLNTLIKSGFIKRDPTTGRHAQSASTVKTGAEVTGEAVIRHHKSMLTLAKLAAHYVSEARRFSVTATLRMSDDLASQIKGELQQIGYDIVAMSEKEARPDQVYQLNTQFFPFTKK
jgi:hypothetical protein